MPPPAREQLQALLLALLASLLFLGAAVLPTNSLVPYPPEAHEPLRSEALAAKQVTKTELLVGNVTMGDKYGQSLAWDRIIQDRLRHGELPLWTRDIAGGVPFVPQMAQVYQPWNLLLLLLPAAGIYGIWYLLHQLLFGFFAYRFLRRLGVGHVPALLGMVTVVLGLWTQAQIHHNVILTAALPAFAILSCVHHLMACRDRNLLHVVLLGLGIGLTWLSGFAPVSLQISYLAVAFAAVLATQNPRGQRLGPLLLVAAGLGLGVLLASAQLIPVLFAKAASSRTIAPEALYAHKALSWNHLLALIWPDLLAWPRDHFYGDLGARHHPWAAVVLLPRIWHGAVFNYKETAFAIGIVPLVFAVTTFGRTPPRHAVFFGAAAVAGLLLALAPPGILQLTAVIPGARAGDLKRFLFLFALAAPVLAALGAQRFLVQGAPRWGRLLTLVVAAASGLLFLLHLAAPATLQAAYGRLAEWVLDLGPGTMDSWAFPDEAGVNQEHLLWTFAGTFLVAGLAWVGLKHPHRPWALLALILLTTVQLASVGQGTIVAVPTARVTRSPKILQPVLESYRQDQPRPRLQRLVPPPGDTNIWLVPAMPNLGAYWGVEDMSAYSPLPKKAMEDLFTAIEPDRENNPIAVGGAGVGCFRDQATLQHPLLDLLGIEWILTNAELEASADLEERTPKGPPPYRLYRRTTCLPRATFVTRAVVVTDPRERLRHLGRRDHDPRRVVVLEEEGSELTGATEAKTTIQFHHHRDEEVALRVETTDAGYLRLADPYDPGWTVTVNGSQEGILVADHYLRAVYLPAGKHQVVFRYDGPTVVVPQRLSLLALLLLAAGLVLARFRPQVLDGNAR